MASTDFTLKIKNHELLKYPDVHTDMTLFISGSGSFERKKRQRLKLF